MAKFTTFVSTDLSDGIFDYGTPTEQSFTSSNIRISDGSTYVINLPGSYTVVGSLILGGTVNGATATAIPGGSVLAKLENVSLNALTVAGFITANDAEGLANYVFGGNDTIIGSAFNDMLTGLAGNDSITGNAGNDTLLGDAGNDTLNGGAGVDVMRGGSGNDTYFVNVASDITKEDPGAGIDTVNSTVTRTLGLNIENLVLIGPGVIHGTGNALANKITGNGTANKLNGLAGNDSLSGAVGNDILNGALTSTLGRNEIDTLTGGPGIDRFVLAAPTGRFYDNGVATNSGVTDYARITDFTVGLDRLQLKGVAAEYFLSAAPAGTATGRGLYHDTNGNGIFNATDELIAVIRSNTSPGGLNLTHANTIATAVFV
jgi:Ca2+-binding RTX toxin-like protein